MPQYGPKPAYADEMSARPFPRFQCVRPSVGAPIGGKDSPADWCVISQAAPTTPSFKPSDAVAHSDANSAYEGVASSTKTLVMFKAALPANTHFLLPLGSANSSPQGQFDCNIVVSAAGATTKLEAIVRVRPVTASYDISALTWNQFIATPPTMALGSDTYQIMLFPTAVTGTFRFGGYVPPIGIQQNYGVNVYGCVIDATCGSLSAGTTLASQTIAVDVPIFNSKLIALSMD